jgi:DNA-binding SARP family transcriptional activator/streptogramin lyase
MKVMEFRILGPLEIVGERGPVTLHRGKEQALLTFLLLHPNELLPSERLIDELWDGQPPATAAKILQNAVSQLRKALGLGRLETRPPGYVFHLQPDELDLDRFERLAREGKPAEALALWRGTPLVELRDERFADDARRRLEEQRLDVLEDRIDTDLAAGRHAQLIGELERLTAQHPLRERLHGQLMRALYNAGRQADALDAYQRARHTLSQQLGLDPGPELQEIQRRILKQDPQLAPARPPPPARPAAPRVGRPPRRLLLLALAAVVIIAGVIAGVLLATGGTTTTLLAVPNSLAVIDPHKNRVVSVIPIGGTPRGVAVGRRYVWTANAGDGTLTQVDPRALRTVQTIGLGAAATALVEAFGTLWVATGSDDTVVRVDPRSGGVLGPVTLPHDFTSSAYTIAAGAGSVWVGSGNEVVKIDPSTGEVAGQLHYGGGINDLAVSGRNIWLVSSGETVARISVPFFRETGQLGLGNIPTTVVVGGPSVWVGALAPFGPFGAAWRIDPVTVRVLQTTRIGRVTGYPPMLDAAYGAGSIWFASYDSGMVLRIDPDSANVVERIHVGGHPSGIAVGDGRVWVTVS